jgi:hypothetical protein
MRNYARMRPNRVWAVENVRRAGRPPAQRLGEAGEHVVDAVAGREPTDEPHDSHRCPAQIRLNAEDRT